MHRLLSTLIPKIEVERKFLPTHALLQYLRTGARVLPSPHPLPTSLIRDVYYDVPHTQRLAAAGVWVRRRTSAIDSTSVSERPSAVSAWEAKVRIGGTYIHRVLGEDVYLDDVSSKMDVISDSTTRRLSAEVTATRLGSPSQRRMPVGDDLEGFFPSRLELAIDQVVETPAAEATRGESDSNGHGQFAAASALLAGENLVKTPAFFYHEIGELELLLDGRQSVQVGDSAMHAVDFGTQTGRERESLDTT
uniref:CYTH domain-containing protein n=1 Tax=Mycena chlorophos TaxID=658473 RepID=A0ABQ0LW75_MYCCL|nr:predicted protein [Mycena chlorophos]